MYYRFLKSFSGNYKLSVSRKIPAVIHKVIAHTPDLMTVIFRPLKRCPNYKPGQFLHLALDQYDPTSHWPESRIFSIANSPTRAETLKITYSIKGHYTSRMFKELKEGRQVWLKLPFGSFDLTGLEYDIVLIAGGTGITPFTAFLEWAIDNSISNKIMFFYGVREKVRIIYEDLIKECCKSLTNFQYFYHIEQPECKNLKNIIPGKLEINKIYHKTSEMNNPSYCISGPYDMTQSFKLFLEKKLENVNNILVDEWE